MKEIFGYAVVMQLEQEDGQGYWSLNDDDAWDSLSEADEACAEKTRKRRALYGERADARRLFVVALSKDLADQQRANEAEGG